MLVLPGAACRAPDANGMLTTNMDSRVTDCLMNGPAGHLNWSEGAAPATATAAAVVQRLVLTPQEHIVTCLLLLDFQYVFMDGDLFKGERIGGTDTEEAARIKKVVSEPLSVHARKRESMHCLQSNIVYLFSGTCTASTAVASPVTECYL